MQYATEPPGPQHADDALPASLLAHIAMDHLVMVAIDRIHRPDVASDRWCTGCGQLWPCPTNQAFDQDRVADQLGRWHALPLSHVTPPCPECGEPARRLPQGGGAVLRHLPGCASLHAMTGRAEHWRDYASELLADLPF